MASIRARHSSMLRQGVCGTTSKPYSASASSDSACVANSRPTARWTLKTMMSSLREAATFGSCWRMEPAAALRGLARSCSPRSARFSFSSSNTARDM